MKHIRKFSLALPIIALIALVGCGGSDLSTEDAHDTANRCRYLTQADRLPGVIANDQTVASQEQANAGACLDDRQKRVIANPNGFPNIATACDGYGHRIYTTTDRDFRLIADPTCPGWSPNTPKMGVVTDNSQ